MPLTSDAERWTKSKGPGAAARARPGAAARARSSVGGGEVVRAAAGGSGARGSGGGVSRSGGGLRLRGGLTLLTQNMLASPWPGMCMINLGLASTEHLQTELNLCRQS